MRATEMLAGLSPAEPPRLAFLRRASVGVAAPPETLLCLSASFNPMTVAHAALIREGSRLVPAQETLLLLATANVDKRGEGLPLELRFDLLLRFADSRPDVSVAAVGHGQPEPRVVVVAAPPDRVLTARELEAVFSPDGRWIAYSSADRRTLPRSPNSGLYVQPFPATGARYQVPKQIIDYHPAWAPTGEELFYVPALGNFSAVRVTEMALHTKEARPASIMRMTSLSRGDNRA